MQPEPMDDFAERIAAPTPTPGGGAVAARVCLYAVSLLRMVTGITQKKLRETPAPAGTIPPSEGSRALERIEGEARALAGDFTALEREDMAAFEAYLAAVRLPRGTPEEKEARRLARARAALRATEAPLATLRAVRRLLEMAATLVELSKSTPLRAESDLSAAVELGHAAARIAGLNIQANLGELTDADRAAAVEERKRLESDLASLYSRLAQS